MVNIAHSCCGNISIFKYIILVYLSVHKVTRQSQLASHIPQSQENQIMRKTLHTKELDSLCYSQLEAIDEIPLLYVHVVQVHGFEVITTNKD